MKPETRTKEVERLELHVEAVELRRRGKSYRDIGKALSIPTTTAHRYVHDYFTELATVSKEKAEEARELESLRLDKWLEAINEQIEKAGSSITVDEETGKAYFDLDLSKLVATGIKLSERRAKLWGLDAPAKVEHRELPSEYLEQTPEQRIAAHEAAIAEERAKLEQQKEARH